MIVVPIPEDINDGRSETSNSGDWNSCDFYDIEGGSIYFSQDRLDFGFDRGRAVSQSSELRDRFVPSGVDRGAPYLATRREVGS